MAKICYNCGITSDQTSFTKEHVPAKAIYDGLGEEFKLNRITVPACEKCNNLYSKIDQELRDVLAVKFNGEDELQSQAEKGFRSIFNRKNWVDRLHFENQGNVLGVSFSYDDLRELHIKNFKALYFQKFGHILPLDFKIDIISEGDEELLGTAKFLYSYLIDNKSWESSGHKDIFKYILKDYTEDSESNFGYESNDPNQLKGIGGIMVYHNKICAIVFAARLDFYKELGLNYEK